MTAAADFDDYLEQERRPAVLLHRIYPPTEEAGRSHYGGLPSLPGKIEWPRDAAGRALHFLVQIDCAALPFASLLPSSGLLLFFGRDDEEQIWDGSYGPGAIRVLHIEEADVPVFPCEPPEDLAGIGGFFPHDPWRDQVLEGEEGPRLHAHWPIQLIGMDTFPQEPPEPASSKHQHTPAEWLDRLRSALRLGHAAVDLPPERSAQYYEEYEKRYAARRIEAIRQATGETPEAYDPTRRAEELADALLSGSNDDLRFPFFWFNIADATRALLSPKRNANNYLDAIEATKESAQAWLARSAAHAPFDIPDAELGEAFRRWLQDVHRKKVGERETVHYSLHDLIVDGLRRNILAWSGEQNLAVRIPSSVYAAMKPWFCGLDAWGLTFSQMLGHAPSAQEALSQDDPRLCLLNLASERALGTIYGDVGNALFLITPEALVAKDLSKVEAEVVGH